MRATCALGGVGLGLLLSATAAHADPLPVSAAHVATPGQSVVSTDTTDALVLNPANLSYLPGPELRWTWVDCPDSAVMTGCGHAWQAGTPLFLGMATALRVDWVQPPWDGPETSGVGFPFRGWDYAWLTWGLSIKLGERASFGASIEHSYSHNGYLDSLTGINMGLSWRPNTHFAFAAVARDFNRPSPDLVRTGNADMIAGVPQLAGRPCVQGLDTDCSPVLDGSYVVGMAFRPTGRRNVDIGLELQYWQGFDEWTPRLTAGVDVPYVGRAYASMEVTQFQNDVHRGWLGTAGLEVHFEGLSAGGGMLFGNGLGSGGEPGGYLTAAISAYTQPGIPAPAHAVWMRLEDTPGTREHVALLRRLWRLADDRSVDAVTLVLRAEPASSFAHAEELADALRLLRAHGKKVLCSLEDAGPKALYVCANADRVVVEPGGGVRYAGLKAQYIYLKGLLDKLGIKADFVRIGPHKTAPEQFTNEHAGPVAAQDHEGLLAQQEAVFVRNMSLYRHMSEQHVREETDKGPFVAEEAKAAGFVDGFAYDDELERVTRELVGRDVQYEKYQDVTRAPDTFSARGKIAILYLNGDIVDGRSQHIPLLDMRLAGSYTMEDTIRELREDPTVRAVVFRIESPGGSSLASDVMWRELTLLGKKKPLIVSMGTVAASGGYYVASASRDIFAEPLTITGSIGVFYGKADVSGLLDKIGVTVDTYKTAPRADAESFFRGFTPDEERELHHKVEQFYDTFLDRVSQGRGMSKEAIDEIGRGRVWTGQQAVQLHLVDHLGGLRQALEEARQAAYLPQDAPIVEVPRETESLLQKAVELAGGASADERAAAVLEHLPPSIRAIARAVAPMVVYRSDEPLARMEWVDNVEP